MPRDIAGAHAAGPGRAALVSDPVVPTLLRSTAPLAAATLAMFAVQLAETWLTGLLGGGALAALGFSMPVVVTAMSFGIGLGAGASAVVGRALGAEEQGVATLCRHVLWLAAGLGLAVAVAGWLLAGPVLGAMGAEGPERTQALAYLRCWFPGAVPLLAGMAALSLLRAAGDTRFQGAALAGAAALAFLLDWPLAFGVPGVVPGLGLAGLGVAASLAWSAMLVVALWRLRRLGMLGAGGGGGFAGAARRVMRVGVPAAATNAIIPLATGLFTAMMAAHGTAAVAGFAVGSRVETLCMTAFFALSAIANPFAAQNLGAGRMDRVRTGMRASLIFCAGLGLALAVALWLFAGWLAHALSPDAEVAASAALYLTIMPWGFGAVGAIAVVNAAFNGLERPFAAVAVSLARTLALGVPAAWLGGHLAGEAGTLAGILAANLLVGAAAGVAILRGTRAIPPG